MKKKVKSKSKKMISLEVFAQEINKSSSLSYEQKRDIINSAKKALGEEPLEIKVGCVYKSKHGLRMIVDTYNSYSLVSLGCYDKQYAHRDGKTVGGSETSNTTLHAIEAYLVSRNYQKIGTISEVLKNLLKESK